MESKITKIQDFKKSVYLTIRVKVHITEYAQEYTQFKKGVLPKNTRPVGSIYKSKDQNLIKIAMPNKWVQLSRYNYEKAYSCKLTSKDKILHLNGNKFDDDVDNLVVVNNQILARLCKQKYIFADRELTRVCVTKEKLLQKIKELENE